MRRELGLALALVVAAAAFEPLVPSALVKGTALVLVLVAALSGLLRRVVVSSALVLGAGLLVWFGLGLAWTETPEPTMLAPWLVLVLGLAVGGALSVEERRRTVSLFAAALPLAVGALVAVEALRRAPLYGGFGNGNALGLAVAPCVPLLVEHLAVGLATRAPGRMRSLVLSALGLTVALVVLACSESRTAWVALALVGGVFLASCRSRALWFSLPILALGVVGLARGGASHALQGRLWIARSSLQALVDVAPLGAGTGGFARAYLEGQARLLASLTPREAATTFVHAATPHGDALGVAVTGGAVGLLLVGGFVIVAAKGRSRGELASLGVVLVAGLGDDVLVTPAVALTVVLTTSTRPLVLPRRIHQVAALAALAASAILLPTLVRRIGSQHALHGAERASDRLDDPRPLLVRARRIDPTDGEAALGLGLAHLVEREPERALVELRVARARFADVGTSVAIGNAELALGRPLAAVASYREALRLDPGSFRARANLVEALRSAGELDSARAELAVARTLQPHHPKLEAIAERLRRSEVDDGTR